jgi:hypothetical protein
MRCRQYLFLVLLFSLSLSGQELKTREPEIKPAPGRSPNANETYKQLRSVGLSGEVTSVNNLVLKRDAGTFTFRSGTLQWLAPVHGKVTGAVFVGEGEFTLDPPLAAERRSLALLTKEAQFREQYSTLVLRFTDATYEDVTKAAGVSAGSASGAGELQDVNNGLKNRLRANLHGRILMDVLNDEPGGLFAAFIKGKRYNGKELFMIDPFGALSFAPEEVAFMTWDENKYGVWAAFHYQEEYRNKTADSNQRTAPVDMVHHTLDTQIEKGGKLNGDAITQFKVLSRRLRVLPLDLFPTLRVSSVTGQDGEALDFIQEGKDDDADLYVILPRTVAPGESYSLRTIYSGKDAVSNEGAGNYFPLSRSNWYPNGAFGDYATYQMTFRTPKGMRLVANGKRLQETAEGNQVVSQWESNGENTVAGFNLGDFKMETKTLPPNGFQVETYANTELPGFIRSLQNQIALAESQGARVEATLDSITTTGMMKKATAEAELCYQIYTDYFGPTPFKRIAMTQQTATGFGQSWPELVYLPLSYLVDDTIRRQLFGSDVHGYFKVVGPHEVAHQWWGHTVGWNSYRDQWMSEGFSEFSASLLLQRAYGNDKFKDFWNDELQLITDRNKEGFRAIDVGPVTLGYRLSNARSGFDITRRLIYPKGGYILHMLRMMMYSNQTGDETFKQTMRDFVKSYYNKPATTEDFKAVVEKHMTEQMDLDGNRRLDWFFDQYVYGTALPVYRFESSLGSGANGKTLKFKITQSGVGPDFKMLVPVYVEMSNGRVTRLGSATIIGNSTVENEVPLGNASVKRAMINHYNDVLALMEK